MSDDVSDDQSGPPLDGPAPDGPAPDGLELAKQAARAAAAAGSGPAARRHTPRIGRRRSGSGSGVGTGSGDRDPQLLGASMERLIGDHGWELELRVRSVLARWDDLVGPEIAEHTVAESFADGVLVVRADSTAWATQLRLLTSQLLTRLNAELGAGTVTAVETLGPAAPSWKKGRLSVKGRGPRDTYG